MHEWSARWREWSGHGEARLETWLRSPLGLSVSVGLLAVGVLTMKHSQAGFAIVALGALGVVAGLVRARGRRLAPAARQEVTARAARLASALEVVSQGSSEERTRVGAVVLPAVRVEGLEDLLLVREAMLVAAFLESGELKDVAVSSEGELRLWGAPIAASCAGYGRARERAFELAQAQLDEAQADSEALEQLLGGVS